MLLTGTLDVEGIGLSSTGVGAIVGVPSIALSTVTAGAAVSIGASALQIRAYAATIEGGGGDFEVTSRIGEDTSLSKAAEKAGRNPKVQADFDKFTQSLQAGNTDVGSGTKALGNSIRYLRARSGARLFFRKVGDTFEILAKSDKNNENEVIDTLKELYGR